MKKHLDNWSMVTIVTLWFITMPSITQLTDLNVQWLKTKTGSFNLCRVSSFPLVFLELCTSLNFLTKFSAVSQVGKQRHLVVGVGRFSLRMYFMLSLSTYYQLSPLLPQPSNKSKCSWMISYGGGKKIRNTIGHTRKTWSFHMMKGVLEWGISKIFAYF